MSNARQPASQSGQEPSRIQTVLTKMRRHYLWAGQLRAIVTVLILAVLVALLDALLGLSSGVRWLAWLGIALAAALVIFRWWRRGRAVQASDVVAAVEESSPSVGQLPRTARDLQLKKLSPDSGVSPEMAADVMKRAGRFWAGVKPEAAVDVSVTRRWPLFAGLAALVFAALFVSWGDFRTATARLVWPSSQRSFTRIVDQTDRDSYRTEQPFRFQVETRGREPELVSISIVTDSGEESEQRLIKSEDGRYELSWTTPPGGFRYRIEAGDGQSESKYVECLDAARLVESEGVVVPPAYVGAEAEEFESGDVEGLEGSSVELAFEMTAPMESARLTFDDGEVVEALCEGNRVIVQTEIVAGKRVYDLVGLDRKGHELEPVKFLMDGRADKMPVIEIVEPKKEVASTPVGEVPVRIRARDDVGLGEVGIILEAQGEQRELLNLPISEDGSIEVKELALAALEEYSLSINDNVRLFAYAKDKKPRGEARAVSEMRAIDIQQFQTRWYASDGPP